MHLNNELQLAEIRHHVHNSNFYWNYESIAIFSRQLINLNVSNSEVSHLLHQLGDKFKVLRHPEFNFELADFYRYMDLFKDIKYVVDDVNPCDNHPINKMLFSLCKKIEYSRCKLGLNYRNGVNATQPPCF